ncbi:MAG: heavy-metal-associated domain-containing protein, partial [Beijerinckiaceae bacterium]|nr:heavy-metal-associated domain-containing protein [Beijerinckiaceae bacterium]
VQGMTCEGCVAAVTRIVKKADPQADVHIDLASGNVDISSSAEPSAFTDAIQKAGYEAQPR